MSEPVSNEAELPSASEIAKLPRWARVALAARCARRVMPLFKSFWPDGPKGPANFLDAAITLAERAAGSASVTPHYPLLTMSNTVAVRAAIDRAAIADSARSVVGDATSAAIAAAHAAAGYGSADRTEVGTFIPSAGERAGRAALAAAYGATASRAAVDSALRHDINLLKFVADREKWTDETPVPPEFFGPFWPEGEPEGWPDDAMEPRIGGRKFKLIVEGPPGASREEAMKNTRQLVKHLDRLNRASGGNGLRLDDEVGVFDLREVNLPLPTGGGA